MTGICHKERENARGPEEKSQGLRIVNRGCGLRPGRTARAFGRDYFFFFAGAFFVLAGALAGFVPHAI
jgi:hypothetical protein